MASPVADSYVGPSGGVVAGGRFVASEYWRNLASGWHNITPTGTLPNAGIMAFSGCALDSAGGKLYLFGGGHRDYWGNEVWEYDLETRGAWVKHYESDINYGITVPQAKSLVDDTNYPGAIMSDGVPVRPVTRHTYYSEVWIDSTKRLMSEGSSTYSGGAEQGDMLWSDLGGAWKMSPLDRWLYSPLSKTWTYDGAESKGMTRLGGLNIYNSKDGLVYSVGSTVSGGTSVFVKTYNPQTRDVSTLSTQSVGIPLGTVMGCVDSKRNRLILVCFNTTEASTTTVWSYDITANTWSQLSVSGSVPNSVRNSCWPCAVYSNATDKVLLVKNKAQGMYSLDLQSLVWSASSIGTTSDHLYTTGGWVFDPRRKVGLLIHATSGLTTRIWAYKE